MASGNSHIGYLCNNKGNKFVPKPVAFEHDLVADGRHRSCMIALLSSRTAIGDEMMKKVHWMASLMLMIVLENQTLRRWM